MRRTLITALMFTIMLGLLINTGCKTSDPIELALYVSIQDGATGTPESGTYYYGENEEVSYSYSIEPGYARLTVVLDGVQVEASGTITMNEEHILEVFTSEGSGEFQLHVSHGTGVEGTPESGYYYYNAGEQVDYSYSLVDGYTNLVAKLDGVEVASTGTVTISQDHTLYIYSEKEYYIQGSWTLGERYEDGSSFQVTLTFSGETENGTVVDSDGGTGIYTVSGNSVEFTIEYPEVRYEYSGTFIDEENMSGDAERHYITENTYKRGTWAAVKGSTSSRSSSKYNNKGTVNRH